MNKRKVKKQKDLRDHGTPELRQHHVVEERQTEGVRHSFVADQIRLDTLLLRKNITQHQYEAGKEIFELYKGAGRFPISAIRYDSVKVQNSHKDALWESEYQVKCWQKLNRILRGTEPVTCRIIREICCYDAIASVVDKQLGKPRHYSLERLREGLDLVALNIGLISRKQYENMLKYR